MRSAANTGRIASPYSQIASYFAASAAHTSAIAAKASAVLADIESVREIRLDEYRAALHKMDWTFEFADDGAVYRAGRDALADLREMQAELDADGSIWRSIAPCGHGIPQPRVGSTS